MTDATGATIVRLAEPLCPSLAAVMETVPTAFAVTRPELDTVAMVLSELVHVMVRPLSAVLAMRDSIGARLGAQP